ncbi:hypothetical protein Slin14017_G043180 [Septoria linicola]|nr:hypothetical protein Slin14017_G043180 [Septoria linicola]
MSAYVKFLKRFTSRLRRPTLAEPTKTTNPIRSKPRLRLMNLPPEIRLLIYEYLTQRVAVTSNAISDDAQGLCKLQVNTLQAGVFMVTPIPQLTTICKQFSSEYTTHMWKRSSMIIMAESQVPSSLHVLPWPQESHSRWLALREVKECRISLSWALALGRGQPWEAHARQWMNNHPSFSGSQPVPEWSAWSPTRQVYRDLRLFINSLRKTLAPNVGFVFVISLPSPQCRHVEDVAYPFNYLEFARLLGNGLWADRDGGRLIILTMRTPSCTVIEKEQAFWTRRRGNVPFWVCEGTADSKTMYNWIGALVLRDGEWSQTEWYVTGIVDEL